MENKIKIVWRVMTIVLLLSVIFYVIALKGLVSFAFGLMVFILAMIVRGFIKGKGKEPDEREMYLGIAIQFFALLAGVSSILVYLGISQITGIKTDNMLDYAFFVYVLSWLPLYKIFGFPRMEI